MTIWSYEEMTSWLEGHMNFEATGLTAGVPPERPPSLDRMRAMCALLGSPEEDMPVIHVTGTNGKGSTARMITDLLMAQGLRTATFTSPHLHSFNERMAYNGEPISDGELSELMAVVALAERAMEDRPTWFELLAAGALRWFSDLAVDAAVLEVGLGGRWDATNVACADVSVVTNVSYDHVEILGPGLEDIAGEKSGIIKKEGRLVLGETDPALVGIFEGACVEVGARSILLNGRDYSCVSNEPVGCGQGRLVELRSHYGDHGLVRLALNGAHQGANASTALTAAEEFLGSAYPESRLGEVLGDAEVPGRLEILGRDPLVVLDGAHNVAGVEALGDWVREECAGLSPKVAVVGMLAGRDPGVMLELLKAAGVEVAIAVRAPSPRSQPPDAVRDAAQRAGLASEVCDSMAGALARAGSVTGEGGMVVVTGSLYVVGEARDLMLAPVASETTTVSLPV